MARNYDLNPAAAKEANSGGKRITEPGEYVGTFRAAWAETSKNGTDAVGLFFVSDSGQEAGPLMLYTHRSNGEELPSFNTLNAIMACLKVRKLEAKRGRVKFWDFDERKDVERDKETFPELMGKRIGIVLQGEEQEYQGDIKKRLNIGAPFCAETRRMAGEILDKQTNAEALGKYLKWFLDGNQWKRAKPARGAPARSHTAPAADDDFDSEIPF